MFAPDDVDRLGHVLGDLEGTRFADAADIYGPRVDHRAGSAGPLIGTGVIDTIGGCVGAESCLSNGRVGIGDRVGMLRDPVPRKIRVEPGENPKTRGGLDKEIVRRTIRRHMNEVRHCYEQRLAGNPALHGRLVVDFAISAQGLVVTSSVASSNVGDSRLDACVVQAVRRWPFPAANTSGLTLVSYPFVFVPAGG